MKDEAVYLRHILEAITNIEAFTRDGYAAFLDDIKTQHAVLRDLQTLEATVTRPRRARKTRKKDLEGRAGQG